MGKLIYGLNVTLDGFVETTVTWEIEPGEKLTSPGSQMYGDQQDQ